MFTTILGSITKVIISVAPWSLLTEQNAIPVHLLSKLSYMSQTYQQSQAAHCQTQPPSSTHPHFVNTVSGPVTPNTRTSNAIQGALNTHVMQHHHSSDKSHINAHNPSLARYLSLTHWVHGCQYLHSDQCSSESTTHVRNYLLQRTVASAQRYQRLLQTSSANNELTSLNDYWEGTHYSQQLSSVFCQMQAYLMTVAGAE